MSSYPIFLLVLIPLLTSTRPGAGASAATATETTSKEPSVLIIGAGAAGLAAASRLMEHGIKEVLVLEAEDRIGGRIESIDFGQSKVELGADWIEGEEGNAAYELVREYGHNEEVVLKSTPGVNLVYYSNGESVEDELVQDLLRFDFYQVEPDENITGISVGDWFYYKYDEAILEKYANETDKLKICVEGVHMLRSIINARTGCFDWKDLALENEYERCSGDQQLSWNGKGYNTIFKLMLSKLPPRFFTNQWDNLLMNKLVMKISWRQYSNNVTVRCADGSIYTADHLIFTPSLGTLKHDQYSLFTPNLPKSVQNCISLLGYGSVMKIPVFFSKKWWQGSFEPMSLIWRAEDRINLHLNFSKGPVRDGESWVSSINTILPAENNPNVLIIWITGPVIPELETVTTEVLTDGILYVLNKFLGERYDISKPDSMTRSTWYTNPHFRGTHSYPTIESRNNEFNCNELLGVTLWHLYKPTLLIAGEATSRHRYGTVHGAMESGYRTADEILRYHNLI